MKTTTFLKLATAFWAAGVAADFQIYFELSNVVAINDGDVSSVDAIRVVDGPPSCDDVNNKYAGLSVAADASGSGYSRCDGCGDWANAGEWDIAELELHAANDWGHFTIYKNGGYQLTPADGSPIQGTCKRDPGNIYECTTGLDQSAGKRLFSCTSPKGGILAK